MAKVHLMVGLPCAGKTIWAKQIEAGTGAVHLTPDAWQTRIYGNGMRHPDHTRIHDAVEAVMVDLAGELLTRGVDVILDFGFWSRAERRKMRHWAESVGAVCAMHYAAELASGDMRQAPAK